MPTYKNTSGDYTITVAEGNGTLIINADLDVIGNITYVESEDLKIKDAFITVAGDNTGSIASMGLVAQKTTSTFAGLRYNSAAAAWQVSIEVSATGAPITSYTSINTGNLAIGGSNTFVQFNDNDNLGGTANLTFDSSLNKLTLNGHQIYGNIGSTPTAVANSVAVYNKVVGSGGTGLYVKSTSVDDELVSKTKAIVFGIIF